MTTLSLTTLADGPLIALRNNPRILPQVRAGLVRMTSVGGVLCRYELTEAGRRKQAGYHMRAHGR